MEFSIRNFEPADLPTLRAITMEAFDGVSIDRNIEDQFGKFGKHDWKLRKAQHIDVDAARDPEGIFVALDAQPAIVGFITTWIDLDASTGHIPNLAVSRKAQGNGIGRALIQHAIDYFQAQDLAFARIETLIQNEVGRALYPQFGFTEIARQIHYGMKLKDHR